jgi:hypothetical protein
MAVEQEKSCENIPINHAGCHIAISRANHTYFKPGVSEVSQWSATEVARHNTGSASSRTAIRYFSSGREAICARHPSSWIINYANPVKANRAAACMPAARS